MKTIYKIFFAFSILLTIVALAVTVVIWRKSKGEILSADFRGGVLLEVSFSDGRPNSIIREREMSETRKQEIIKDLSTQFNSVATQVRFDDVGPTVGQELKSKSVTAMIVLLITIVVYLAIVFRSMKRVLSPWALGIAAVLALLHDLIIPMGVMSLVAYYYGVEITAVFVAAALTILGYSVSDTVVVFDRVRENVIRIGSKESFPSIVHTSIMQTLTRSINTSITTLIALVAIFFFGGESIKYFALALIIGIISGTYSSIFIASPIIMFWHGRKLTK